MNTPVNSTSPQDFQEARRIEIGKQDLPLHCPLSSMTLWNSHPRVYLPIEKSGQARCPYCGTEYVLKE